MVSPADASWESVLRMGADLVYLCSFRALVPVHDGMFISPGISAVLVINFLLRCSLDEYGFRY